MPYGGVGRFFDRLLDNPDFKVGKVQDVTMLQLGLFLDLKPIDIGTIGAVHVLQEKSIILQGNFRMQP